MAVVSELPPGLVPEVHALAERLAELAGDEAAVLEALADLGRTREHEDAQALCVLTLAYTYADCIVGVLPAKGTHDAA